ncbi:uncharacterized protein LOC132743001 [Ruditapes philippinarum]|uniref:uncharacterized protein LOC132743001 n=1 Tax=Ruditapes philippinarum TaxID=129788 RepID=UPI00295BA1AD|nr:uncharacterized protein LOC132743001 [Ruditapes philippinarum]XP_060587492.1 uncharacterized protein LOC132743001 [Ruditapes philippinarum]
MPKNPCVHCDRGVYSNHRAVECDSCHRWQHLLCGNTGISVKDYRKAVHDGSDLPFTCIQCSPDVDEHIRTPDKSTNNAERNEQLSVSLEIPVVNNTSSDIYDIEYSRSETMDYSSDSDYDVTRNIRDMAMDPPETTFTDAETVQEVPVNSPIEYEIVNNGSLGGKPKLVSSEGYSFVKKRTFSNGTIDWRCSVRHKGSGCLATIKELNGVYRITGQPHNHASKPGLNTAVQFKSELKEVSKTKLFESASNIVSDISRKHQTADQPPFSRPSQTSLLKLCNRARQKLRPEEPVTTDFEVDEQFLENLGERFHCVRIPARE